MRGFINKINKQKYKHDPKILHKIRKTTQKG